MHITRIICLICLLLLLDPGGPKSAGPAAGVVIRLRLEGAIGPMTAELVDDAVSRAETDAAVCLVLELDTPGGLDVSMRRIVKRILSADVPVVVYVSPGGSRAASAGTFITLSAHVAAMAPGTNIGAAHPVQLGGAAPDTAMAAKMENDAAAYIRSLAARQGRNADWSEKAVRESASITAEEALELGVIDLVAPTITALLDSLDGRQVELLTGPRIVETADPEVVRIEMGARDRLLSRLSDPNIAYILMILGIYGLMFEFYSPGALLPGIVGGICVILAFFAFQSLPVNYAGLMLVLLGVVFFILEVKVTSYGALTVGGLVAMTLGSAMLFDSPGGLFRVSWTVIAPAVVATFLFFTLAVAAGLRAQRRPPLGGPEELVGRTGSARSDIHETGSVFVAGEYWQATADEPIPKGRSVTVIEVTGSVCRVEKA